MSPLSNVRLVHFCAREYDVSIAGTGTDALRLAAEQSSDLIVLDLGLAGLPMLSI
jgi:DNA-binding response OmpR family regulator